LVYRWSGGPHTSPWGERLVLGVVLAGLEPEEMLTTALASARGAPSLAEGLVIGTNVTMVTAALGLSASDEPNGH